MEVTNKELERIMTKIVQIHRRDWVGRLVEAVWDYNITHKTSISLTPYELVFGKRIMLPIELEHKTLRATSQLD